MFCTICIIGSPMGARRSSAPRCDGSGSFLGSIDMGARQRGVYFPCKLCWIYMHISQRLRFLQGGRGLVQIVQKQLARVGSTMTDPTSASTDGGREHWAGGTPQSP